MPLDPQFHSGPEKCPDCGAPLPEEAPQGLCPKCLFARLSAPTEDGAEKTPPVPFQTPEELAPHFPQLEILECLGRGGMGVVYKARQKTLNRFVALKLLAPERVADAKFAKRFTHEAQALAALNHPNIVTIYDFGQAGGFYFLLMEFVDGVNLRQAMKAGRFTPEQALAIVPPVCEALQFAHDHGIVHRDIKPENLLLDKDGRVKIADFGIAKMLGADASVSSPEQQHAGAADSAGTVDSAAGTPQYMAPEQKEHRVTDHRADIYSLGVVLYELLTGELPGDKLQPPSSRLRGIQIDVRLDEIVLRALEKAPEFRYQTAVEFRTQVEKLTALSSDADVAASGGIIGSSRFSRTAIIAASWITLSIFVLPPFFWHELKTHEFERGGPFGNLLGVVVFFLFLLPAFTAPMGATILGWIAVSQIRRSMGKLHGLWLAVFDGLCFPLLALDAWIILAGSNGQTLVVGPGLAPGTTMAVRYTPAIVLVVLLAVIIVVDFLIIRAVWRAVNKDSSATASSTLAYAAMFFAVLSAIVASWVWFGMLAPSRAAVYSILLSALLGVTLALPVRQTSRGKVALLIGSITSALWLLFAVAGSDGAKAQIHTLVFEADAKLVDELVPGATRTPAQARATEQATVVDPVKSDLAGNIASRAAQTAEINADVFARLLGDGANPPGVLDEQIREGTWWPKVPTNSHYMRHGNPAGGGNLDGALGLRQRKGALQLHVEFSGMHGMNSAYQVVNIVWEGVAPRAESTRAFFIPVSRTDGTARYLVIALEVGKGTENAGGIANVDAEKQGATAQSASFGPVVERVVQNREAIDFDSGKLANFPTYSSNSGDAAKSIIDNVMAGLAWAESEGMDAVQDTSDSFLGVGMKVVVLEDDAWEKMTATDVRQRLAATPGKSFQPLKPGEKQPANYAFQTRESGMGILQILGAAGDGVRLRYKLMQSGAKTAAGAEFQRATNWLGAGPGLDIVGPAAGISQAQMRAWLEERLAAEYPNDTYRALEWGQPESVAPHDWVTIRYKYIVSFGDKPNHYYLGHRRYTFTKTGDFVRSDYVDGPEVEVPKPNGTFGPVTERVLPSGVPCRQQYFQFRSGEVFVVGNGPGTSKEEADYDEKKIDDAGGVDMSAAAWEEGISIVGRGCFFTQDVEGLKWDSITAEQVMERLKYVSFVSGVVEPKTKDFPITYLFKTARGEVGIMEVLGVVDDQRDGWKEKGMKFRYRLVLGTGTTTAAATTKSSLVFGPETRGLQAALEVTPGEPFNLRIHVRNVSDHGISIGGASYRQDDECLLTDALGQPVSITKVPRDIKVGMKGGYFATGQVAVFECAGLSFQPVDRAPASAGYVAKASPGRYTLRFRLRLPGDDVPFSTGERDWKGELETGPVTIEVKEPVTPIADSPTSAILGPVAERVVNDLQTTRENCALSFDSGKLLSVPANITLDTLTNPSEQPVAVAWARDNEVDAVAFISADRGKIVKCGLLCPGLIVLRATNPDWVWDSPTPRELKEEFDKAMHEWKELPHIAEVTSDGTFPINCMILDTRTRRRGVLQITGVAENPRGVKLRYRLVEGAPMKKTSGTARP